MNVSHALLGAATLTLLLAAPARADLAEPPPNAGASHVEVVGTQVRAEAWAVAKDHRVETIVVTRLDPGAEKRPRIATYERWSVDGHKKFERGDRKLGRAWEKALRSLLDEARTQGKAQPGKRKRDKKKDLLGRLQQTLGSRGARTVGDWVVGWSLGEGTARNGGRPSLGRVAVITFTPAAPTPVATPRKDDPTAPPAVTPRPKDSGHRDAGHRDAGHKRAARATRPAKGKQARTPVTPPTTPARKSTPPSLPRPESLFRERVGAGLAAGASAEGSADSEKGVRQHARVVVDLAQIARPTTKKPAPKTGPTTPGSRGR